MTFDVVVLGPDASIDMVIGLLIDQGVNRCPVVADAAVFGIIGRADILKNLPGWNPVCH